MSFRQIIFVIIICLVAPSISLSASKSVHKIIKYAYHNDTAKVMELVNSGIPVDTRDHYGKTTLMWAVVNENIKMAEFLILKGADVNASDGEGTTVLMWAVVTGNPATVSLLIDNGADINRKDMYGKTALMSSRSRNNREISDLLKKNGATK